jgi:alpha-ketoglutarate-dependent taurine dioxygenase
MTIDSTLAPAVEIRPLPGITFGAEVLGVDLRNLDDDTDAAIQDAFARYGILVFHDQELDREAHMAFARRFGAIELQSDQTMRADFVGKPIVLDISNVDDDGVHIRDRNHPQTRFLGGNEGWHSDSSFKEITAKASVLVAIETPSIAGETGYADMRAAYDDALSDAERERLEGLSGYHSLAYSQAVAGASDTPVPDDPTQLPGAWHPLIATHPVTGRKSLFIGRHTAMIGGMPVEEGRQLLENLLDRACRPPRIYYHSWRPGDVVIWDNRCMLHRATSWDLNERRVLRHVRVGGDGPAA